MTAGRMVHKARLMLAPLLVLALVLAPGLLAAQVVVIYSHMDSAPAQRAHQLAAGLVPTAIIDRQLVPGVQWRPTIAAALCQADRVLLLWSARAAASPEVRRELDTALVCRRQVLPILLDDTPLPGLLADIHAVDWRRQPTESP